MNPSSKDISELLAESSTGLGLISGTDLFYASQPSEPDSCVTVLDSGGITSEARYVYERPSIQILVRGNKYTDAYAVAHDIKTFLNGLVDETINSTRYVQILAMGDILPLGRDENKRSLLSLNFRIHRTTT